MPILTCAKAGIADSASTISPNNLIQKNFFHKYDVVVTAKAYIRINPVSGYQERKALPAHD